MARPKVRDDVALMDGYHSPQVDVRVRLNTNEAPDAPPEAFVDALAVAMRGIAWNRYPDRGATALRARIAEVEGPEVPAGITASNVERTWPAGAGAPGAGVSARRRSVVSPSRTSTATGRSAGAETHPRTSTERE